MCHVYNFICNICNTPHVCIYNILYIYIHYIYIIYIYMYILYIFYNLYISNYQNMFRYII